MPSMTAMPNKAIKPIAAETLNAVPVRRSAKTPPIIAMGMTAMPRRVSVKEAKLTYSNMPISSQGDNHPEALDCVLKVAEFADPFQALACGPSDFLGNLALRLEHRAAQIPPANAEFDGNIALLLLAVDERGAGHQVDVRDLTEGYLRDLVGGWILNRDRQTTDRLYVLPIFGRQSNDQREVPITSLLVEVARGLAADGGLNRRIDVTGRQPITRGCLSVDIDAQRRLAERGEDRKISHTAYFAHRGFDLVRRLRQHQRRCRSA